MNKTPNYQLNQWEANDRVLRVDFNADNAKIDTVLGTLSSRISAVDANGLRLYVGSYAGTGEKTRSLDFSQTLGHPVQVLVVLGTTPMFQLPGGVSYTVSWTADSAYGAHNEEGKTYRYFAFG